MKKIISILLALCLSFSAMMCLVGCGEENSGNNSSESSEDKNSSSSVQELAVVERNLSAMLESNAEELKVKDIIEISNDPYAAQKVFLNDVRLGDIVVALIGDYIACAYYNDGYWRLDNGAKFGAVENAIFNHNVLSHEGLKLTEDQYYTYKNRSVVSMFGKLFFNFTDKLMDETLMNALNDEELVNWIMGLTVEKLDNMFTGDYSYIGEIPVSTVSKAIININQNLDSVQKDMLTAIICNLVSGGISAPVISETYTLDELISDIKALEVYSYEQVENADKNAEKAHKVAISLLDGLKDLTAGVKIADASTVEITNEQLTKLLKDALMAAIDGSDLKAVIEKIEEIVSDENSENLTASDIYSIIAEELELSENKLAALEEIATFIDETCFDEAYVGKFISDIRAILEKNDIVIEEGAIIDVLLDELCNLLNNASFSNITSDLRNISCKGYIDFVASIMDVVSPELANAFKKLASDIIYDVNANVAELELSGAVSLGAIINDLRGIVEVFVSIEKDSKIEVALSGLEDLLEGVRLESLGEDLNSIRASAVFNYIINVANAGNNGNAAEIERMRDEMLEKYGEDITMAELLEKVSADTDGDSYDKSLEEYWNNLDNSGKMLYALETTIASLLRQIITAK